MLKRLSMSFATAAIVVAGLIPAAAATKIVEIPARRFQPEQVTIFVGDTVRWIHRDNLRHTVTANSSSVARGEDFDSSPSCTASLLSGPCMTRGDTFSHEFTTAGTFTYRCRIHGSDTSFADCEMCGQVIVKLKSAPPPSTSPPTSPSTSPPTTGSPSPTDTATASPTGTATSPGPNASGPPDDGAGATLAIAAAAVLLLASSGWLVYRTYLRT